MRKGAALALMVGSPMYLPTLRSLGLMPNLGSYNYPGSPVPMSCALYGTSPYVDCKHWETVTTFTSPISALGAQCLGWGLVAILTDAAIVGQYVFAWWSLPGSVSTHYAVGGYVNAKALESCLMWAD
jgi:hypothetical protein